MGRRRITFSIEPDDPLEQAFQSAAILNRRRGLIVRLFLLRHLEEFRAFLQEEASAHLRLRRANRAPALAAPGMPPSSPRPARARPGKPGEAPGARPRPAAGRPGDADKEREGDLERIARSLLAMGGLEEAE